MGNKNRNRKRKQKKRKKLYNKKQFVGILCRNCNLCKGDPVFCYTEVYRSSPQIFLNSVYPKLKEVKAWNNKRTSSLNVGADIGQFRYIFCIGLEGQCGAGMQCEYTVGCFNAFQNQIFGAPPSKVRGRALRRRRQKQRKKKYVAAPYPTVFMSDNDDWINFIKGLFNEDTSVEQDPPETSPECTDGKIDTKTENSEPET